MQLALRIGSPPASGSVTGLFGFAYFGPLTMREPELIFIAIVLSFVPHDLM
jgi:hypothetical protein